MTRVLKPVLLEANLVYLQTHTVVSLSHTHTHIEGLRHKTTHIAIRGDRPGLLSLPLLLPWSMAPFISSRIALARELRVGLPMEAVVYRGMLFSAIEV